MSAAPKVQANLKFPNLRPRKRECIRAGPSGSVRKADLRPGPGKELHRPFDGHRLFKARNVSQLIRVLGLHAIFSARTLATANLSASPANAILASAIMRS